MLLSSNTSTLCKKYTIKEAISMMADAGFDAIDFSFFDKSTYDETTEGEEGKKYFLEIKKTAQEKNMVFNQAHAPFPSSVADHKETEKIFENIVRAIKNASYLGVKNIVVHPVQHLKYAEEGNPEKLFDMNMEFYKSLEPYCKEYNIKVALENMWQTFGGRKISHSTCSRPKEFIKYLDTLNSDCFVACLDIGHAMLVCEDPDDFIRELGRDRLKALHVHDVDGISDSHTLPYYGIVKWDKVAKALADIDYDGDFTFESDYFIANALPKELYPDAVKYMAKTGRYIMSMIKK